MKYFWVCEVCKEKKKFSTGKKRKKSVNCNFKYEDSNELSKNKKKVEEKVEKKLKRKSKKCAIQRNNKKWKIK